MISTLARKRVRGIFSYHHDPAHAVIGTASRDETGSRAARIDHHPHRTRPATRRTVSRRIVGDCRAHTNDNGVGTSARSRCR